MTAISLREYQQGLPQAFLKVEGQEWAIRDSEPGGVRIPVVFLPGAGGTGDVFYKAAASLMEVRRTITLRYPALSEPEAIVSGLIGLFEVLALTVVDLATSSLGGYLAQAIVLQRPRLVRRLLLGNTFYDASWLQAILSRESVLSTSPGDHLARTRAQLEAFPEQFEGQIDYKTTMLALVGAEQTGEMAVASLAAVLASQPLGPIDISLDGLAILDTEDDPVVDPTVRQAMRDRYRGASFYPLQRGGHYPSLLNAGEYTAAALSHFG